MERKLAVVLRLERGGEREREREKRA